MKVFLSFSSRYFKSFSPQPACHESNSNFYPWNYQSVNNNFLKLSAHVVNVARGLQRYSYGSHFFLRTARVYKYFPNISWLSPTISRLIKEQIRLSRSQVCQVNNLDVILFFSGEFPPFSWKALCLEYESVLDAQY